MISIRTNFRYSRKKSAISNSQLWNAMMHPFTKMTVKGAIWYQGLYHSCWYTSIRGNVDIYEEMYALSFCNSDFWRFNFWGFFFSFPSVLQGRQMLINRTPTNVRFPPWLMTGERNSAQLLVQRPTSRLVLFRCNIFISKTNIMPR